MQTTVDIPGIGSLVFSCHDDHIGRMMQHTGAIYEADVLAHIAAHVPRDGLWVDVGACIGTHCVPFAKLGAQAVMAFEPLPENIALLHENLWTNEAQNKVDLWAVALGRTHTSCSLISHQDNMGMTKIAHEGYGRSIPVFPLDSLTDDETPVHLIKIDVEGYECHVLEGAERTIARWHPRLYIEVAPENMQGVNAFLAGHGYQCLPETYGITPVYVYV